MLHDRLAILISRKLAGEASAEELQELFAYLQQHPEDQYFAALLEEYWSQPGKTGSAPDGAQDDHFARLLRLAETGEAVPAGEPAPGVPRIFRRTKYMPAAAAVLAALLIGGFVLFRSTTRIPKNTAEAKQSNRNEVVARRGVRSRLVLPDGSTVWLNAETKVSYNTHFNDSVREVDLEGEAFFDVAKDAARPFIVHTAGIDIRVLGTAFNVKSYARDSTIETTLVQGMIEVVQQNRQQAARVILHPREKLVFSKQDSSLNTHIQDGGAATTKDGSNKSIVVTALPKNIPDTAIAETSWIYNRLVFEGDTFRELAVKMERWFNVKIQIQNEKVAAYRFRGMFANEDIDQALKALQLTAPFRYTIKGDEVEIFQK
jgi:ferric-dicitrate binding protein FerR (iron transport regulator)